LVALNSLWLTTEQAKQIAQQAANKPTEEICGLLFGSLSKSSNQPPVSQITQIDNLAVNAADCYEMHPAQLIEAQMKSAHQGLELVAIYHSHPQGQPIPSATDVTEAHYPDAVYLIVSLIRDEARFAAWSIRNGEVNSIPFQISDYAPEDTLIETALSRPQKAAVVLSALLAVAFLLVVSLALLPPAPPLPN
jgi:proteasome lid subunit RPN8/RPN11